MTAPQYTGTLAKGDAPGTVTGELRDAWGWVIRLTGTRSPDGGYVLHGTLGEVPEALRIEGCDPPVVAK